MIVSEFEIILSRGLSNELSLQSIMLTLPRRQKAVLRTLSKNNINIIITSLDKNGSVVIMDGTEYNSKSQN